MYVGPHEHCKDKEDPVMASKCRSIAQYETNQACIICARSCVVRQS